MSAAGMERLRGARVLLAGIGGLGSNVAMTLARLGVGSLVIRDPGILDEPDLNRQILYNPADLGRPKVEVASHRLREINPDVSLDVRDERITRESVFPPFDICLDCLDSFGSRAGLEQALLRISPGQLPRKLPVPVIHGGAEGWFGQVSTLAPGGAGYEGLFGTVFTDRSEETAQGKPIMPHVVALVAAAQVQEFIRWCDGGVDAMLVNRILVLDGLSHQHDIIALSPR
jgi:molybdopterin-synthase adenylyltransferase